MEIVCPNDAKYADEIAALLKPPSPQQVQEYYDKLLLQRGCNGLRVKQSQEFGKGVYASLDFKEEELVLKDEILLGAQHSSNKIDCLVCSFCFRFIGSIELQIGRKLYLQDLGVLSSGECHMLNDSLSKGHCQTDASDEEDCLDSKGRIYGNSSNCAPSTSKDKIYLPKEVVKSLMNGELVLPHSQHFSLPSAMSCPGGCEEAYYCSESCAEADWGKGHSLLCTGRKSKSFCREALAKFIQHANETNDIFILAAKAISFTVKRYRNLKEEYLNERSKYSTSSEVSALSLLLKAWKPISMGYKARWWDCIALPEDVDPCDEASFRMEIKELAYTSLLLLKDAMLDKECEALFSLEIYGHIIGMFELNNLDLVVESPVENYFLFVDDLPIPEKEDAEKITQPILDALGEDYSVCCQGTAFFPLQSCMNHSCHPNAKAFKREEDKDGQATIIALRHIRKGEEIMVSGVDVPSVVKKLNINSYPAGTKKKNVISSYSPDSDYKPGREDEKKV